jgi:hypothetical protein
MQLFIVTIRNMAKLFYNQNIFDRPISQTGDSFIVLKRLLICGRLQWLWLH